MENKIAFHSFFSKLTETKLRLIYWSFSFDLYLLKSTYCLLPHSWEWELFAESQSWIEIFSYFLLVVEWNNFNKNLTLYLPNRIKIGTGTNKNNKSNNDINNDLQKNLFLLSVLNDFRKTSTYSRCGTFLYSLTIFGSTFLHMTLKFITSSHIYLLFLI